MADLSFSIDTQRREQREDKEYHINLQSKCHWFLIFSLWLDPFPATRNNSFFFWGKILSTTTAMTATHFKHFKSRRKFSRFLILPPSISFWCVSWKRYREVTDSTESYRRNYKRRLEKHETVSSMIKYNEEPIFKFNPFDSSSPLSENCEISSEKSSFYLNIFICLAGKTTSERLLSSH